MAAGIGAPGAPMFGPGGQVTGYYDMNGTPRPGAGSAAQANEIANASRSANTPSAGTGANGTPVGGAGGATGATVPGDQQALTGFASRYAPGMLQDMVYDSPETVLYDLFNQMGIGNQGSGIYQSLADFSGADPMSLYTLQTGGGQDALGAANAGDYTNWLAAQYMNQGTAGGGAFNFQNLMANVFGQNPDASQNNSLLYNLITAGSPTQQVSNVYNMARDAGRVGLNPLAQAAMLTSLQRAAQGYQSQSMQGITGDANTPFYDYLNQQNPGLVTSLTGR